MGKSRRKYSKKFLRRPRGYKAAKRDNVRPGAIPPNEWEDLPISSEAHIPTKVAARMLRRGETEGAVRATLMGKFGYRSDDATDVIRYVIKRYDLGE
jgi:hypothetical protein